MLLKRIFPKPERKHARPGRPAIRTAVAPMARRPLSTPGPSRFVAPRDYADPTGLDLTRQPCDGFTVTMPTVVGDEKPAETKILPPAILTSPSRRPDGDLWRPPVSGDERNVPVGTMRRRGGPVEPVSALPPRTADVYPGQRRLGSGQALFQPLPDESPFARTFQAWLDSSGVICGTAPARAAAVLDTRMLTVVAAGEFPAAVREGRDAT